MSNYNENNPANANNDSSVEHETFSIEPGSLLDGIMEDVLKEIEEWSKGK